MRWCGRAHQNLEGAFWFFSATFPALQPLFEQISALLAHFSRQPADASSLCATALDQWLAPRPFANQLTAVTPYFESRVVCWSVRPCVCHASFQVATPFIRSKKQHWPMQTSMSLAWLAMVREQGVLICSVFIVLVVTRANWRQIWPAFIMVAVHPRCDVERFSWPGLTCSLVGHANDIRSPRSFQICVHHVHVLLEPR